VLNLSFNIRNITDILREVIIKNLCNMNLNTYSNIYNLKKKLIIKVFFIQIRNTYRLLKYYNNIVYIPYIFI